jgi:TM2 domain-containing membrane protein YozV/signal peptidase I
MMEKRNSFTATGLGLLFPGLGHLYLARPGRFLVPAVIAAFIIISLGFIGVLSSFYGAITYFALIAFLILFSSIDSFVTARKKEFTPNWYNRWYMYALWILLVIVLFFLQTAIRESFLGCGMYRIKIASVPPAIGQDDWVLVDTHAFRDHGPTVGEIVLVRRSDSSSIHGKLYGTVYIGRVTTSTNEKVFSYVVGSGGVEHQNVPLSALVGKPTVVFYSKDVHRVGLKL